MSYFCRWCSTGAACDLIDAFGDQREGKSSEVCSITPRRQLASLRSLSFLLPPCFIILCNQYECSHTGSTVGTRYFRDTETEQLCSHSSGHAAHGRGANDGASTCGDAAWKTRSKGGGLGHWSPGGARD